MTVKQARRFKDMTTSQMATALGISRDTYEKKEKNTGKFTIEQIEEISKVVGIPKEKILFTK